LPRRGPPLPGDLDHGPRRGRRPGGELDLAGAAELERELQRLAGETLDALVIDLRDVAFMDSSGLRVVALAARVNAEQGRRFALVRGAAQVMRVFEITRMAERLGFVDDPGEVTGAT